VAALYCCASISVAQSFNSTLYLQDFDGLTRTDSVNERRGVTTTTVVESTPNTDSIPNAFTHTGPAGWTVNNNLGTYGGNPTVGNAGVPGQGVASYGVDEWEGWSFANIDFWIRADDQNRSQFSSANGGNASGVVAVADSDEYFDLGGSDDPVNGGFYNTSLVSPGIAVAPGLYTLSFDSSWRDESFDDGHPNGAFSNLNNQAVEVVATFNDPGNTSTQIEAWNSDNTSGQFKDDTENEQLSVNFGVPAGATSVQFQFNYANAGNDWWWAIDNIDLAQFMGASVYSEDFESVTLGGSVNERETFSRVTTAEGTPDTLPRADSFTHDTPPGWSVDNSGLSVAVLQDDMGVFEWEGWSFASLDFWTFADGQGRGDFLKCVGNCAIADSDEWKDLNGPAGPMDTVLVTPAVDISGVPAGQLAIQFDSSWRPEGNQVALLTVDYGDGNGPQEVLRFESDGMSPNFHPDNTNETVYQRLANPAGAASAQFAFSLLNSDNNWWWAIDNVRIGTIPEPSSMILMGMTGLGYVLAAGRRRP
jgi:hypothetical protein